MQWFTTLLANSISSFEQLEKVFYMHFVTSQAPKKSNLLHSNALAQEIKDLNEVIIVHQITMGLHGRYFSLSFAKKTCNLIIRPISEIEKIY